MVNPLPRVTPEPEETVSEAEDSESEQAVTEGEPESKRSTLSRTTDWIIKSIARVQGHQQSSADETEAEQPSPSQEQPVQPGLLPESAVRKTSTWPERLQRSSRAQTRFVLVGQDGTQHTLGEALTGIGSAPHAPDGETLVWVSLSGCDSIDPLHLRCGVDDGVLWIEDNNSVYGTVIEEPGRSALQCIPFERYFVIRGSTITLGHHPFTLQ